MVKIALSDSSWVKLSEWETHQEGWTQTRKCIEYHQVPRSDKSKISYLHNLFLLILFTINCRNAYCMIMILGFLSAVYNQV